MAKQEGTKIGRLRKMYSEDPDYVEKYRKEVAAELEITIETLGKYLSNVRREFSSSPKPKRKLKSEIRTISVDNLIDEERLDLNKILREGLEKLRMGVIAYDSNLSRDLGISKDRWKEVSNDPEFDDFRCTLPNRKIVWGHPETIEQLREMDGVR